jgi:hypothetical protein
VDKGNGEGKGSGKVLTIINNSIRIVEINAMIAVWEKVDIVILHPSEIQLV